MTLPSGSLINDRYRIDEVIARGGMGAIYRAFDVTLNIEVAVKENFYTGEDHSRQFRLEATILASLRHPNLPRVTDHFSVPDQGQYLVMDYIDGEDLRHLTNRSGPMSEADVVRVGCAISDALDYLHHRQPPVVHRDIKPGNIKVTPQGGVFLVDFGLAKISQPGQNTTAGAQALTPGYAPPEQYGQGTEPRSDIYALGATLYAVLTGKVPEDGLARVMGTAELTPVQTHQPSVSNQTAMAIEKAMAIVPGERFQTGHEFREALCAQYTPGLPVETTQKSKNRAEQAAQVSELPHPASVSPAPGGGWVKLLGGTTLILILLIASIFIILPVLGSPAAAPPPTGTPPAPTHPLLSSTAVVVGLLVQTSSSTPTLTHTPSPDRSFTPSGAIISTSEFQPTGTLIGGGEEIAFASNRSGIPQIWAMQPDGSQLRQITQLPDGACQPGWNPDRTRLVFISPCRAKADSYPGSSLYIINSDGTGLVLLPTLPGGDFDPAWSPDGQSIAFTSLRESRPNIYVLSLEDKSVVRLSSPANYERYPVWSPDGSLIAYETTRAGFPQIWLMQADGKEPGEFSTQAGGRSSSPDFSPDASILVYTQGGNPSFLVSRQLNQPQAAEFRITDQLSAVSAPDFSPDGWWIATTVLVDENFEIYKLLRNGSSLTRLTENPAADFDPAW